MAPKKDKSGYRIFSRWDGFPPFQLTKPFPTIDKAPKILREKIRRFSNDYCDFSTQVRTASDVTDYCRDSLERAKFDFKNGMYIAESDGNAFAAVKYGSKPLEEGFRLIFSHNDSPGLGLKTKPVIVPWDPDQQELHLGLMLDLKEVGVIQPGQWGGHDYLVKGYYYRSGKKIPLEFRGYITDVNAHTDTREVSGHTINEAYPREGLDLITGYRNLKDFLKSIGLKSETEFQKANLQVYPDTPTRIFGQGFITGHAHDARIGTFSTLNAFNQTKSPYTTVLVGFDREETGSQGPGGACSTFLDDIVDEMLLKAKVVNNRRELTESLKRSIYKKSFAINSDVDVSASDKDSDASRIDFSNISKFGYGPFLLTEDGNNTADQSRRRHIDQIMDILGKANVIFYPNGSAMTQENGQVETCSFDINKKGLSTFAFGVPVAGTHSVSELAHEGDLYYSFLGNKAFLKADWKP